MLFENYDDISHGKKLAAVLSNDNEKRKTSVSREFRYLQTHVLGFRHSSSTRPASFFLKTNNFGKTHFRGKTSVFDGFFNFELSPRPNE